MPPSASAGAWALVTDARRVLGVHASLLPAGSGDRADGRHASPPPLVGNQWQPGANWLHGKFADAVDLFETGMRRTTRRIIAEHAKVDAAVERTRQMSGAAAGAHRTLRARFEDRVSVAVTNTGSPASTDAMLLAAALDSVGQSHWIVEQAGGESAELAQSIPLGQFTDEFTVTAEEVFGDVVASNGARAPIAASELPSYLHSPAEHLRVRSWTDPDYEQRIRWLMDRVPSGEPKGYGNIPAGMSGLLAEVYREPMPGHRGGPLGAVIGDTPNPHNHETWYTGYAVAGLLPELSRESNVRALLVNTLPPSAQNGVDQRLAAYQRALASGRDTQPERDALRDYLDAAMSDLPRPGFDVSHAEAAQYAQVYLDGMVDTLTTAVDNDIAVIASGDTFPTAHRRLGYIPDEWSRVAVDRLAELMAGIDGNYLMLDWRVNTNPLIGVDASLGTPSFDSNDRSVHSDRGRPVHIAPGTVHYGQFEAVPYPPGTDIPTLPDRSTVVFNPNPPMH